MRLIAGTRGSKLALTQTERVAALLRERFPEAEVEFRVIKTKGDKLRDAPLARIGGKGLFVKEIDEAVLRGEVDFAVHSMKDVPTELLEGLVIAAVPEREDVRDVLVSRDGLTLEELQEGAVIGTSSVRRQAMLRHFYPHLRVRELRGNVDTRLRKLEAGEYDAVVMALAGLRRLGLESRITQVLPPESFTPSVGQGAIAVVAREGSEAERHLRELNHPPSYASAVAERAMLRALGGGCQVPVGAYSRAEGRKLKLLGVVLSPDGSRRIAVEVEGSADKPEELGKRAAAELLDRGARELIQP
ncbi:MAG: hydroxymethylbilane synthase [Euryarchaeota archaeon]|nr:hydroxymethylbilane synthase [Euryarchaeota archaeon]